MPKGSKSFKCFDCMIFFTIYTSKLPKRKIFCPYCGDIVAVKRHDPKSGSFGTIRPGRNTWTPAEEKRLLELIKLGRYHREIAEELGRSTSSVHRKATEMRRKQREQDQSRSDVHRSIQTSS